MSVKRIVVIGASAGGIDALKILAAGLPRDFPAPICLVVHTAPESPGMLDVILTRGGTLTARTAVTGDRLEPGRIYVAPPDHHLLVEPGMLRVAKGPRENRFRPAIDPLFRSAAQVFGPAAIGVILTGNLDDGTAGLWAVKQLGGVAIVQDPADALFPAMPKNALRHVAADYCVPLSEMAELLVRVVAAPVDERGGVGVPEHMKIEVDIARAENAVDAGIEQIGQPSSFACPECHGVLLRLKEINPVRFRCHTGHAYSAESLVAAIGEGIEEALWIAVRSLEESGLLMQQLSRHLQDHGDRDAAHDLAARAREARRQSDAIRESVTGREPLLATK